MNLRTLLLILALFGCAAGPKGRVPKPTMNFQVSSRVLDRALSLVNLEDYDLKTMTVGETQFHILGRKAGGLGIDRIERSLVLYWPFFSEQFVEHPDEVAIVDEEGAAGVTTLDRFILAVYSSHDVSKDEQQRLTESVGWKPKASTEAYARANYRDFRNSRQAYVDDVLTRAFGHLLFGHGVTTLPKDENERWFAPALANLYGKVAWHKGHRNVSPYFKDGPEDVFLQELRSAIGPAHFDLAVNALLAKKSSIDYGTFKDTLSSGAEATAEGLEAKYGIDD